MLGHQLWRHLHARHEVWVTLRKPVAGYAEFQLFEPNMAIVGVDASNYESLASVFKIAKPEAVVNCVGIIKQHPLALDPLASLRINSLLPHRLAEIAAISGARVVHVSTDCVFSGVKGAYREEDQSDANDLYGRSKFLGELSSANAITIRSSIIGHELETRSGLIEWFLSQEGKKIKGYERAIYTGFTTCEMARIVERVLLEWRDLNGLWHVSSDPISKYELLRIARKHYNWYGEIIRDQEYCCDRSLNSDRFRAATGYAPPNWEVMIEEMAREYKLSIK